MKTILLLMSFLIVLSYSTLYYDVVREDFSSSTFPPEGWVKIAKSPGGGGAYGGWTLQAGVAHGEVNSSYMTSYAILFTPAFHLQAKNYIMITFQGKPCSNYSLTPLLMLTTDGTIIWGEPIQPVDSMWRNFQYETTPVTEESYNYRVGWEVDCWMIPSVSWSKLDIDNVKVIVVDPSKGNKSGTQVEASSVGRLKSLYK